MEDRRKVAMIAPVVELKKRRMRALLFCATRLQDQNDIDLIEITYDGWESPRRMNLK